MHWVAIMSSSSTEPYVGAHWCGLHTEIDRNQLRTECVSVYPSDIGGVSDFPGIVLCLLLHIGMESTACEPWFLGIDRRMGTGLICHNILFCFALVHIRL